MTVRILPHQQLYHAEIEKSVKLQVLVLARSPEDARALLCHHDFTEDMKDAELEVGDTFATFVHPDSPLQPDQPIEDQWTPILFLNTDGGTTTELEEVFTPAYLAAAKRVLDTPGSLEYIAAVEARGQTRLPISHPIFEEIDKLR